MGSGVGKTEAGVPVKATELPLAESAPASTAPAAKAAPPAPLPKTAATPKSNVAVPAASPPFDFKGKLPDSGEPALTKGSAKAIGQWGSASGTSPKKAPEIADAHKAATGTSVVPGDSLADAHVELKNATKELNTQCESQKGVDGAKSAVARYQVALARFNVIKDCEVAKSEISRSSLSKEEKAARLKKLEQYKANALAAIATGTTPSPIPPGLVGKTAETHGGGV